MKTAIITDSNSGMTQEMAKEKGISLIAMPFFIDGRDYLEGIDLSKDAFFRMQDMDYDILTSQPTPQSITQLWDELLKHHDAIIHIPMSSSLSGACQTAYMLAKEYDGKVFIIDNQRISVTQLQSVLDAKTMADRGMSAKTIADILMKTRKDNTIYITVDTLKYLKKGGRITPAAAALGTLLKIKPVLTIQGGKLDACAKARTMKQAKSLMLNAFKKDMSERFLDCDGSKTNIYVVHSNNYAAAEEYVSEVKSIFPNAKILIDELSLSISCHIGKGSLALAATKKLDLEDM